MVPSEVSVSNASYAFGYGEKRVREKRVREKRVWETARCGVMMNFFYITTTCNNGRC